MENLVIPEILKKYQGKKIILTGNTGFKGSWLAHWFHLLGAEVRGVALPQEDPDGLYHVLKLENRIDHFDTDIRKLDKLIPLFTEFKPDFVFHLAAQALVRESYDIPKGTFDTNVGGSLNVLECIRACDSIKSVVYVTSDKCYKNNEWIWGYRENDELGGFDPYSASKAAAEILFNSYLNSFFKKTETLGISSVRAGNVIGGGDWAKDRIVPDCFRALYKNKPIPVRNFKATRPWQHVLDPLFGYLMLGAKQYGAQHLSGCWNFGPDSGSNKSVGELVSEIIKNWESGAINDASDPKAVHEAGLLQLNCDKAKAKLNWKPNWDFEKTLFYTTNWYKRFKNNESASDITSDHIITFMKEIK
jgi:CDP-glucose 4,6-dehydratase